MELVEITIDTEEIEEFIYFQLIQNGFVPGEKEVEKISDILFDFLLHKKIIKED